MKTCDACPEQYDVFLGEQQVAYFRLRHGYFRADMPDSGGKTVYSTSDIVGDGSFDSEMERQRVLNAACRTVLEELNGIGDQLYEVEDGV